jgi:transcriptional regulator with XRE-family HTH domain
LLTAFYFGDNVRLLSAKIMTPFSTLLSDICHSRGVRQKQLAFELEVDPSYLSALTSGRKGVPGEAFLQKLGEALKLSETEWEALREAVKISKQKYRVPIRAHPRFYAVAWQMFQTAEKLPADKLNVIMQILEL